MNVDTEGQLLLDTLPSNQNVVIWRQVISELLLIVFPLCGDYIDFHRFETEEAAFTAYLSDDVVASDNYVPPRIGLSNQSRQKYLSQDLYMSDPAGLTAMAMTLDTPSSLGDYRLLYVLLLQSLGAYELATGKYNLHYVYGAVREPSANPYVHPMTFHQKDCP